MRYEVKPADHALIEQARAAFGGLGGCEAFLRWPKGTLNHLQAGRKQMGEHWRNHIRNAIRSKSE